MLKRSAPAADQGPDRWSPAREALAPVIAEASGAIVVAPDAEAVAARLVAPRPTAGWPPTTPSAAVPGDGLALAVAVGEKLALAPGISPSPGRPCPGKSRAAAWSNLLPRKPAKPTTSSVAIRQSEKEVAEERHERSGYAISSSTSSMFRPPSSSRKALVFSRWNLGSRASMQRKNASSENRLNWSRVEERVVPARQSHQRDAGEQGVNAAKRMVSLEHDREKGRDGEDVGRLGLDHRRVDDRPA